MVLSDWANQPTVHGGGFSMWVGQRSKGLPRLVLISVLLSAHIERFSDTPVC